MAQEFGNSINSGKPLPENRPNLLEQTRGMIRVKHYSIRTEEAYVGWVKRFVLFHNKKHPKYMGEKEIEYFLTHLAVEGNVAASTQNQALNAIVFLYREVLKQEIGQLNIEWSKQPPRLPLVLSKDEVRRG